MQKGGVHFAPPQKGDVLSCHDARRLRGTLWGGSDTRPIVVISAQHGERRRVPGG